MPNFWGAVGEAVIIVGLVLANGFFVAAKSALVKAMGSPLHPLENPTTTRKIHEFSPLSQFRRS
jgi:CBS domain containing-hemolysin-like protein